MPGQNATPLIGWHSADPTLKPWLEAERQRRGMDSMRELLDEMAAEYRSLRVEAGEPQAEDGPAAGCADCGQPTDGQCVHCARRVCPSCAEKGDRGLPGGHHCPGLDG